MDLKEQIRQELIEKKEKERLERVEKNSKLREIIFYSDNKKPISNDLKEHLINEGIEFTEIEFSKDRKELLKIMSITNFNNLPILKVNGEYLAYQRDFTNNNQCVNGLQYLGDPEFENPPTENKILEHMKTSTYNINSRIHQLSQQITPLVQFIQKLQKELLEEEKGE
tara:strand:- start:164 stop:667 length:504 start_codon:yes stop_codon:yes gene_type:complete